MKQAEIDKYIEKITVELKLRASSPRTIESYVFFLKPFLKEVKDVENVENRNDRPT